MGALFFAFGALVILGSGGDAAGTPLYSRPYNSDCITLTPGQTGVSLFPKKYMIQGYPMVVNNNVVQVGIVRFIICNFNLLARTLDLID
jgi:hypothetical protein